MNFYYQQFYPLFQYPYQYTYPETPIYNQYPSQTIPQQKISPQTINIKKEEKSNLKSQIKRKYIKKRRFKEEISRKKRCPYADCKKRYGSQTALNLHIKIKHNGGTKTQRYKLAEKIIMCEYNGDELPEKKLNFPMGYLQKFREQLHKKQRGGIKFKRQ